MMAKPFPLLAIDTSGPYLQVGLIAEDGQEFVHSVDLPKGHAEQLFDHIEALLTEAGRQLSAVRRLAVTLGPGSFTGLRIGIAAARGLAIALDVPVIGVPNLLALSLEQPKGPHDILVDAKREQMYVQGFSAPGEPATPAELVAQDGRPMRVAPKVSLVHLMRFAAQAEPKNFPPNPTYIRPADAKPQTRNLIARQDQLQ